jgi:ABC-type multidrug transport system fused ATPase/permease subunit
MPIPENGRESNSAHTSMASMQTTPTQESAASPMMLGKNDISTQYGEAQPRIPLYIHDSAAEADPFDTTRPDWSFDQQLARQLEQGDSYGQLPEASRTSLLFENLQVFGMGTGATYQNTVGLGLQSPITALKKLIRHTNNREKTILHGIDGVVREGQMLLVLGRPGSGCTTLLKALAGFTDGYHRWDGNVRYNGVDVNIVKECFRGDIAYNPEGKTSFKKKQKVLTDLHS